MGLDMFLYADKYLSGLEHTRDENFSKVLDAMNIDEADNVNISIQVGYWRKANAIHNWFVENVQNGEDDCQRYYVDKDLLEELKSDCEDAIIAYKKGDISVVETILAPAEGFFFGSTAIDEAYVQDLENTIKIVDRVLTKFKDYSIYYQSSW